jgi:hypothetical protein
MSVLSQFGGRVTPLRVTTLTASSGTFTPLANTRWFYLTMLGAGGAGGASGNYFWDPGTPSNNHYPAGGRGGSCAVLVKQWFERESVAGTPIASYGYMVGPYSSFHTAWNTGSAGTLGLLYAFGGVNGAQGLKSVNDYTNTGYWYGDEPGKGESCEFGTGGAAQGGTAQGYGAGGGGGSNARGLTTYTWASNPGGPGAPGLIIVGEY